MFNDSFLSDYLSMRDTAQPMVWVEEVEPLPSSNLMDESSEIDEAFSRPIVMEGGQEACQEARSRTGCMFL